MLLLAIGLLAILFVLVGFNRYIKPLFQQNKTAKIQKKSPSKEQTPEKTQAEKNKAAQADAATMASYGLTFDYANLTLPEVVQAYMATMGIEDSQVAFSYKDLTTGKTYAFNDTQPMTAGSTYKLPLNMLVVDKVEKDGLSLTKRYDITKTTFEYEGEHDAYVAAFAGAMSIVDMQIYSLVYSENTPAYALAERLGGMDAAFDDFERYGRSKGTIPTIQKEGNKTTTDYYIQVLDYLWKHKKKYRDLLNYIDQSFPGKYYEEYLPHLQIYQKPGYVSEALNVGAIVMEENPYLVAIYTRYLGGSTEYSMEINPYGYNQLAQLTYVINQWHRIHMNP